MQTTALPALPRPARPTDRRTWTRRRTRDLAVRIDREGPEAALDDLVDLAVAAREAGVTSPVVDLLVDPAAPPVVRERAFAVVVGRLGLS